MIDWIDVQTCVPDNRRPVLVWGFTTFHANVFLGSTKYNATSSGGRFDCERTTRFSPFLQCVTHWAEIDGPVRDPSAKPEPPPYRPFLG